MEPLAEATRTLDVFASVGATAYSFVLTNIHGEKVPHGFTGNVNLAAAKKLLPGLLNRAHQQQLNVIVRPTGNGIIQLDDLDRDRALKIHKQAFAVVMTSPGSYQAWVALDHSENSLEMVRRLKLGMKADVHASGSVRVPGTLNIKPQYAPHFPEVALVFAQPGRIASRAELEPFLAPEESKHTWVERVCNGECPSYADAIKHAKRKADGSPDRSDIDWWYATHALEAGRTIEQVAAEILANSLKAAVRKPQSKIIYAQKTAERAANHIARTAAISIGKHPLSPVR